MIFLDISSDFGLPLRIRLQLQDRIVSGHAVFADPHLESGAFLIPGSGMDVKSGFGMNNPEHLS